jgi:hypothetical protein
MFYAVLYADGFEPYVLGSRKKLQELRPLWRGEGGGGGGGDEGNDHNHLYLVSERFGSMAVEM